MDQPSALFLSCGAICYDSTKYFEQCISRELEERGWNTKHLTVDKKNPTAGLRPCYGKHYDIIFDINTILPSSPEEDGSYCLNRIDGQIWHYILDHPLYHHDVLKCPLKNYNVICLDENHAAFIKANYPHISRVLVLPLAASAAEKTIPYGERREDILFTGTYTDPDTILYRAMKQSADLSDLFRKTVQFLLDCPETTQEEAVALLLCGPTDKLAEIMQLNYLADVYLQAAIREELIKQFLLRGLPVTVYGHGWELFAKKHAREIPDVSSHLKLAGEVSYDRMPEIFANARIALNQTPWFKAGMHDRVPLALQNGCVCLTEKCPYMEERLPDGQELYYFSLEDMEGAALIAKRLLNEPEEAAKTAARGQAYARNHLCWKNWISEFVPDILP